MIIEKDRIVMNNEEYLEWTTKNISDDFGDDEEFNNTERYVEITYLGKNRVNFVDLNIYELNSKNSHQKEDVFFINGISNSENWESLIREIIFPR